MSEKFRLYAGIVRNGKWFNHAVVHPLIGGTMVMLDSNDKSGAARLLNLMKGSIEAFYTEEGEEYKLQSQDYLDIKAVDTWKIGYEVIKLVTGETHPIITENFYCPRCSRPKYEHYTEVKESWQTLIDKGLILEIFLQDPKEVKFKIELPEPVIVEGGKMTVGGEFNELVMQLVTLGDMLKIQKDPNAMATEANLTYATWDKAIVNIPGITEKDLNILRMLDDTYFTKKYITSQRNHDAINQAWDDNIPGIDAFKRSVMCTNCGAEIGGYLDFTNFFSPLLPKRTDRKRTM